MKKTDQNRTKLTNGSIKRLCKASSLFSSAHIFDVQMSVDSGGGRTGVDVLLSAVISNRRVDLLDYGWEDHHGPVINNFKTFQFSANW